MPLSLPFYATIGNFFHGYIKLGKKRRAYSPLFFHRIKGNENEKGVQDYVH